jgi:nucleotide-binding universal stress UspA family protein
MYMTGYRHMLVPLDGLSLAAQALPHAQAIALRAPAWVSLLQVVPELHSLAPELGRFSTGAAPVQRMVADEPLQAVQEQWQRAAEIGSVAETILWYAQDRGVDLTVMRTHGRTGLARLLYGSVAEQVLHGASCPVLLVRAAGSPAH